MKYIVYLLRLLVGGLFIFSGAVKAIDPLGTAYKMSDYFAEFGMDFLKEWAIYIAVLMIIVEISIGILLFLGYKKKFTLYTLLGMIVFFTFLTGYTHITGNVTDCGCFGDFLKLKPIESFYKDVVLLIATLILFAGQKHITPLVSDRVGFGIMAVVKSGSMIYCLSNFVWGLPQADFRPYKVGNDIKQQMIPVKEGISEFVFVYNNPETGEDKEFDVSNLPSAPWAYKDRIEKVIEEGIPAPISNFAVMDSDGIEINDQLLNNPDAALWIVAYDLDNTNADAFKNTVNPLAEAAQAAGMEVFALTASDFEQFRHDNQCAYPFYTGDATFLKTIVRSNPGLLVVKNGVVEGKWHHAGAPSIEDLKGLQ